MGIVRFALRFPHTFYVLAALIVFLGVTAIRTMPTDIFPQINIPVVTIIWSYTGLSTPEMEQRVSTYSQYSISSNVNGIKDMESQTLNGISVQKIYSARRQSRPRYRADVSATNAIRAHAAGHPTADYRAPTLPVPVPQLTLTRTIQRAAVCDYGIYRLRQHRAGSGRYLPTPAGGKYRQITPISTRTNCSHG
jgi:multidrug efflux pump subunit AcrB